MEARGESVEWARFVLETAAEREAQLAAAREGVAKARARGDLAAELAAGERAERYLRALDELRRSIPRARELLEGAGDEQAGLAALAALGLPPGATLEEVRRAFRSQAKVDHPDQGGGGDMGALVALRDLALAQAARSSG